MRRVLKADLETFESKPSKHIQFFRRQVQAEKRFEMVLLKGHLLLEATMSEFIEAHSRLPINLSKTRFSFADKITICRILGMFGPFPGEAKGPHLDVETILREVNKARNDLAHGIDWDKDTTTQAMLKKIDKQPLLRVFLKGAPIDQLKILISATYATIEAINHATHLLNHVEKRRTTPKKNTARKGDLTKKPR